MVWIFKDFKLWHSNFRVSLVAPEMVQCTIPGDAFPGSLCEEQPLETCSEAAIRNGLATYN